MKAQVLIILFFIALINSALGQTNNEEVYITAKFGGKVGIVNAKGEWVIQPIYDDANKNAFASNGLAAVKVAGKWGYINKKGETIINPQFDYAACFADNGLARFQSNNKWGSMLQAKLLTAHNLNGLAISISTVWQKFN